MEQMNLFDEKDVKETMGYETSKSKKEKSIKIKKVVLENYRNFDRVEIDFDDVSTLLLGVNGLGKTNVIEAIFWALSGKIFSGDTKTDRIGITPTNAENGLKTRVFVEFDPIFTVEKVFYEKYSKETNEYQGTETAFYINGALVKTNREVNDLINTYLGVKNLNDETSNGKLRDLDVLSLLYNLNYLTMIDYQVLRELVIKIVGEIDYNIILKENPTKYAKLIKEIELKNGVDIENLYTQKRTEKFGDKNKSGLEDEIRTTEALINEYKQEASKEINEQEIKEAKIKLEKLETEIDELRASKTTSIQDLYRDLDAKISAKETLINNAKQKILEDYQKSLEANVNVDLENKISTKREQHQKIKEQAEQTQRDFKQFDNDIKDLELEVSRKERRLEELNAERDNLLAQYKQAKSPQNSEMITCPHCDKPFSLHEAKEHQAIIELKLNEIKEKGNANKVAREQLDEGISTLNKNVADIKEKYTQIGKTLSTQIEQRDKLFNELNELERELYSARQTKSQGTQINYNVEPIITLNQEIDELRNEKIKLSHSRELVIQEITDKINVLQEQKTTLQQIISQENTRNSFLKLKQEKETLLDQLNVRLVNCETIMLLIKEVQKDMFTKLNEKVEEHFGSNIQFRLFKINLDGSVDTRVCDMLVKDIHGNFVNIKNINSGMFPIRAIEFVSKVKAFYGIPKSFILVDEMYGLLDNKHKEMLTTFGEQIIGTGFIESQKMEIKKGIGEK